MKIAKAAAVIAGLVTAGILGGFALSRADLSLVRTNLFVPIEEITADEMSNVEFPDKVTTTAAVTTVTAAKTTAVTSRTTATTIATTYSATTTEATTDTATETVEETTATETSVTTVTTAAPSPQITTVPPVTTAAPQSVWIAPVSTQPPQPVITEPVIPATEPPVQQPSGGRAISVTDREYIMLCNVVGHEYGADWVPTAEKALIAECIMNRVNSPLFPNTIYDVLMQPGQFAGIEHLILMETMSKYVTQDVRDAVDLYLTHPEQFQHGYLFFSGDGYHSYFRTTY
ncbi:MAG: cell wall hydrolase [Oscillospiraceae bacterium]|nr:cell wall hydrolase [Oscillospiraceae bacterium]